jgi:hypothetical protein
VRALLCVLATLTIACGAGGVPQTRATTATSYVQSAPPYRLGIATPDMVDGLSSLTKGKTLVSLVRDGAVFAVIGTGTDDSALLVLLMNPGTNDVPGFRGGFVSGLADSTSATEVAVEGQAVYRFARNGRFGAVWFDGDFILVIRTSDRASMMDVVRAVIVGHRSATIGPERLMT